MTVNVIRKIKVSLVIIGIIIFIIVMTIGRSNISLQSILTKVVQCYISVVVLFSITTYITINKYGKKVNKKE